MEIGGARLPRRAPQRGRRMKFDAGFAQITWEPEFGGRNGTSMQQVIFSQEEAHYDVAERGVRHRARHDRADAQARAAPTRSSSGT